MIIWLSQQERDKFTAWLRQKAESDFIIAEQMIKIGHTQMGKRIEQIATMCTILANELERIEDMTI